MGRPGQSGQITVPNITTLIISSEIGESQKERTKKRRRRKKKWRGGRRRKEEDIWIPCGIHDPNSHQTQQGVAIFFFPRWSEEKKKKKLQQILRLLCDSS